MKITVTTLHIVKGIPKEVESCPISLAATDCGLRCVSTDSEVLWHSPTEDHIKDGREVHLPEIAQRFIADFDDGKAVSPFEFEIQL